MTPAKAPVRASTQEHLDIEEIKDNLIVLRDGSCCLVAQTTAVNFDLLSETEQGATIFAYASLLNSLSFPIQIFIRSQQKDVSGYLNLLAMQEKKVVGEKLRKQIKHYRDFVEKTVQEKEVLDKKFYIIIPFSFLEMGTGSVIAKAFPLGGDNKKKGLPYPLETILEKAKTNLYPKRDHLIRQFNRLGLELRQLQTHELIKLFYNIYNQEATGFEEFVSSTEYQMPIITTDPNNINIQNQPRINPEEQVEKIKERRVFMDTQQTDNKPLDQTTGGQTPPTAPASTPASVPDGSFDVPQETPKPSAPQPTPTEPSPVEPTPTEPSPVEPVPLTPAPTTAPTEDKPEGTAENTLPPTEAKAQKAIDSALKEAKPEETST